MIPTDVLPIRCQDPKMADTRRPEDPPAHGPGEEAEGDGSQNPVPVSDPGAAIGDPGVAADAPEEQEKKTRRPK